MISTFALVLAVVTVAADPASMTADGLLPVARPDHVRAFTQALQLDRGQLDTVSLVIDDYESFMREAHEALVAKSKASRDKLNDAFSGRRRLSIDAIRALRQDIESAPREVWPDLDDRLEELHDTLAIVSALPTSQVEAASRIFRRQVLLHAMFDDNTASYAAESLDVAAIAQAAADDELSGVDAVAMAKLLGAYHQTLDTRLPVLFKARRESRVADALAAIAEDDATRLTLMKASADRWLEQSAVHMQAIDAIAVLANAAGGEGARAAWLQRAQQTRFPGLYDDNRLQVISEWVLANGNSAQREAVPAAYAAWLESAGPVAMKMAALLQQGFEQGVDLQHDAVALKSEAVDLRRTWLQSSGDRQVRLETARAAIERHLTDGQRAAIRRVIMDPRRR